jgi:osmotically-inducible protein OsmY
MRILLALLVGAALGAALVWYYGNNHGREKIQEAGNQIGSAAKSARDTVQEKLRVLDLRTNDFKDELARTGQIVRRKAREAGQAIADATADARVTAAIKGKLVADSGLASLKISVNTTAGVVTLSGTVPSPEDISKAMLLAMDTDGVREVVSTLQVKPAS